MGRLFRGPLPTARGLPECEGYDPEGELSVLRGPRDHDATGSPRVSGRWQAGRTGLVDPLRPEQIPGARTGRGSPRASGRAVRERRRRRGARDRRRVPQPSRSPRDAGQSPNRTGPARIPRALSRPCRGPPNHGRPDLQESRGTSRRLLLSPALSDHGDPDVPLRILEEMKGMRAHSEQREGECLFCEILRRELASGRRVVADNGAFVALEPFAARFPFETWLLPKVHARAFETISDSDRKALARILKDVLGRMYQMLDDPSFNYYIHTAPVREPEGTCHWHLESTPRLTEIAGFERGTGVLHQSGRARGRGGHLDRRGPLVSPFGDLDTVTDCLRV